MSTNMSGNRPSVFRKRPVEIEAVQFVRPFTRAAAFCPDLVIVRRGGRGNAVAFGQIATLEGLMTAQVGDWIIKGVHGEFYPCKPDIFEATYEPVPASSNCRSTPSDSAVTRSEVSTNLNGNDPSATCDCFPHGSDDACTCDGCWACAGHVKGCTCDVAWDCEHKS